MLQDIGKYDIKPFSSTGLKNNQYNNDNIIFEILIKYNITTRSW